ncbi:MFS transporter [Aquirhabdus sp.]|uniref:MFS transporter n=1 Tax=Aquirhabdus sp. TaxID=2824160 RepID=UPI00396CAF2E
MISRVNGVSLLLICGFLFVFTETILSPFYPQFFSQVFGITDLSLTGEYVALCRFTVLISAPLWGFLAKKIDPLKLLIIGQSCAALITLGLSQASQLTFFLILSVLLLIFKSSYFLFYSLLIELQGRRKQLRTVGQVQLVVQVALIASALASSWVLHFEHPLKLFVVVAALDVLQVILCFWVFRQRKQQPKAEVPKETSDLQQTHYLWRPQTVFAYGLLILAFSIATNSVRPYLTAYGIQTLHMSQLTAAVLYLIPSLMAFAVFPILHSQWIKRIQVSSAYSVMLGLLVISLAWQALAQSIYSLFAARVIFGFSMLLGQALLENHLFTNASSSPHWYFSLTTVVQNSGQLFAPLLAAWVVAWYGLTAPFWLAALLFGISFSLVYYGLSLRQFSKTTPQISSEPMIKAEY